MGNKNTKGTITEWDDNKGYGFITPADGGPRVFVHISAFPRGRGRPVVDDKVSFTPSRDSQNRTNAETARVVGARRLGREGFSGLLVSIAFVVLFFAALATYIDYNKMPLWIVAWYGGLSAVLFIMYGWDKRAAKRAGRRTSEARLHLLEFAGGWPGALLAQQIFRHKTRKLKYQVLFWLAVVVNVAALYWFFLGSGAEQLTLLQAGQWRQLMPSF